MKQTKKLQILQMLLLTGGSVFAWTTVIREFGYFKQYEGTIFKFKDCVVTNPALTPCFWGGVAFLVAMFWSIYIYRLKKKKSVVIHQKKLMWLLVASTVFALSVFGTEVVSYLQSSMKPIQTCSGIVENPLQSSCFYGSMIFLSSLITTIYINRKIKN
jgi:hypothetical protein